MTKSDFFLSLGIGVFLGTFIIAFGENYFDNSNTNRIRSAIEVCEKSLPRDQNCKIVAIPIVKEEIK